MARTATSWRGFVIKYGFVFHHFDVFMASLAGHVLVRTFKWKGGAGFMIKQ